MKYLISIFLISLCGTSVKSNIVFYKENTPTTLWTIFDGQCTYSDDVIEDYRRAVHEFTTNVYKHITNESFHFVFSPLSLWLALASIAEGTEGITRQELFNLLHLPKDVCHRQQYYMIASRRECSGNDVTLDRKRLLIIDDNSILNPLWENFVCSNSLTGITRAPLKHDPSRSFDLMRKVFTVQISNLDLSGNSVMLDTLNYKGLWTSAFSGATVEHVPFHNDFGVIIGSVNMMKMRKRVKLTYVPEIKVKFLELPVGYNSRYFVIFGISVGSNSIQEAIKIFRGEWISQIIRNSSVSQIPFDVSIPQFTATSEIDMRRILEKLGVESLWIDPYATR